MANLGDVRERRESSDQLSMEHSGFRLECIHRLLALDRQYLLQRLGPEQYQTRAAHILADLRS
jgi:hypothetical protein